MLLADSVFVSLLVTGLWLRDEPQFTSVSGLNLLWRGLDYCGLVLRWDSRIRGNGVHRSLARNLTLLSAKQDLTDGLMVAGYQRVLTMNLSCEQAHMVHGHTV